MTAYTALRALASSIVAATAWLFLRCRRALRSRPRARARPRLQYPIVLAHGFMGFEKLRLGRGDQAYFRGVEERLTRHGARVHEPRVRPTASIAERAKDLVRAVETLETDRVNVVAHSMGGLDVRYALAHLGLAEKVASVVTIGTPHRGTPLADLATGGRWLGNALRQLLEKLKVRDVDGIFDLTTERMDAFNERVPDVPGVWYGSYVAATRGALRDTNPLLVPTWRVLQGVSGENDGVVPAASQPWGEVVGVIEADHWAQIGWSKGFDAPGFYETVVRELIARGM